MIRWPAFLLIVIPLFAQESSKSEAVVVGGSGWRYRGKEVARGDRLPGSAELTGSPGSDLVLSCASQWLAYSCLAGSCSVPVCTTHPAGAKVQRIDPPGWSTPKTAGNLLSSFLYHAPKTVQTLGVRAAGNLDDAVLRQSGETVFFAPALARLLEGKYCFVLAPLPPASGAPRVFSLEWNHEGDAPVRVPQLPAGLYTLERGSAPGNGGCRADPDAAKAWVLIATDATFQRANELWQSYSAGLEQLATESAPGVTSTMSHALLAMVADSIGR